MIRSVVGRILDSEKFTDSVFQIDNHIRYVALVDNEYHVLASKMRDGVPSLSQEQTDRNFVSIYPPIIVDACQKLQPFLGKMTAIAIRYDSVFMAFYPANGHFVVITFDPEVETPFISRVGEAIARLI